MSGRLVILPHKRWNVWNQDNVEKVLKDEREERERKEAQAVRERRLLQEDTYERLLLPLKSAVSEQHVNLVSSFAEFGGREGGNEEYAREAREREGKRRRREGVDDWQLGGGAIETMEESVRPWYYDYSDKKRRRSLTAKEERSRRREEERKEALDPMARYSSSSSSATIARKEGSSSSKREKEREEQPPKDPKDPNNHRSMEALRTRRLEREAKERKRAALLLSSLEIAKSEGANYPTAKYSQQYNPHLTASSSSSSYSQYHCASK